VAAKDREHLEATQRHAELIQDCLQRVGGDISTTKSAMGTVTGYFQGVSTGMAPDELVKNFLQDYASENFEIICYRALIQAARIAGREDLIPTFEQIIREEEEMKRWLEQHIGQAIESYMLQPANA
jgi:ferritin-like metal-binding protein YciE